VDALVDLLSNFAPETKVLVFCAYVQTVEYLAAQLAGSLPGRRVESLIGGLALKEKKSRLRRFAPMAQGLANRKRRNDIDILVASDCIAEGENLQDATVLVNFDLHWTPLKLIQRVGRLDRPTARPRVVHVFNFFPSGERFEELLELRKKLRERSQLYDAMARTQVVEDYERDLGSAGDRDVGLVQALYRQEDYEGVLEEFLPTSKHLTELARATEEEKAEARKLPLGSRASKLGSREGVFAFLEVAGNYHCVFRDADGVLDSSPQDFPHEALLGHAYAERGADSPQTPQTMDRSLSDLVEQWAQVHKVDPDAITVVCAETVAAHPRGQSAGS
jgi:superfamily II DNA/RNA helicase